MEEIDICTPVRFFSAGQFVARPGWVHQRRTLDTSVLMLVESGHFYMWEDDRRIELSGRQALVLRAGHTHFGERCDGEVPPVYYWAHFSSGDERGSDKRVCLRQHTVCNDYDKLSVVFHQLMNESRASSAALLACDYIMSLLLVYLSADRDMVPLSKALYMRLQEYIRLNYKHSVELRELSDTFHYSADYLSRLFKKNAGISIRRYQHNLRLTQARQQLLSTVKSVKEIAYDCGYTNEKFFITVFSKYEGISPAQYRNQFGRLHQNDK